MAKTADQALIGEIIDADFEDETTITVRLNEGVTVGHWFVRIERVAVCNGQDGGLPCALNEGHRGPHRG